MAAIYKYLFLNRIVRYLIFLAVYLLINLFFILVIDTFYTPLNFSTFFIFYVLFEIFCFHIDIMSRTNLVYIESSRNKFQVYFASVLVSLSFVLFTMLVIMMLNYVLISLFPYYIISYTYPMSLHTDYFPYLYYFNPFYMIRDLFDYTIVLSTVYSFILLAVLFYKYSFITRASRYFKIIFSCLVLLIILLLPFIVIPSTIYIFIDATHYVVFTILLIILLILTLVNSLLYKVKNYV